MTAEDARRSVEALSQLLRDEVEDAMREADSAGRSGASGPGVLGPGVLGAGALGGRSNAGGPAWLQAGEGHLARALRASRPGDLDAKSASLFGRGASSGGIFSRSTWSGWALAAVVVAGLGLGAGILASERQAQRTSPALAFRTEGETAEQARRSGRVIAPADRPQEVRFSDGSHLSLGAGSMLRVRETDAHGAMVIVEEGQVESDIEHTGKARWSMFAGPYEVRVVGTRFSTSWDPDRQRLAVVLHEGSVQVLGKGIAEVVELKPGQRFDSGGADGQWFVTATGDTRGADADAAPSTVGDAEAASEALAPVQGAGAPAAAHASAVGAGDGPRSRPADVDGLSWSALVAHGRFEEVLEEAGARGEATCLRTCSIADLRALADAARYTGRFVLAERALSQLRSSPAEAPRAGFLLGSMNEAQGQSAAALDWYGRYLAEAPAGGLAAEARAGRMRALLALGQTEAAKAAAKDYLRLHPAGVGASTARQILLRP